MRSVLLLFICSALALPSIDVDVFPAGEAGYFCVKIPDLLATQKGSLLAFAEARIGSCSDFAHTDLVMKRSEDGGKTWGPLTVLAGNTTDVASKTVYGNSAPVQDRKSGRILLPYCKDNVEVFIITSDDDGATWTAAKPIEAAVEKHWKWVGLGPPGGIQLESGRFLIPAYHTILIHGEGEFSHGHTLLSDDGGNTWRIGGKFGDVHLPNENQAVDLGNNTVLVAARGYLTHRLQTYSYDGGETFGPMHAVPELFESWQGCEGSIITLPSGVLLFSNPATNGILRVNMSLFASEDKGQSWQSCGVIDPDSSGYSALAVLPDSSVGILFERSHKKQLVFVPDRISFQVVTKPGCNSVCGCFEF